MSPSFELGYFEAVEWFSISSPLNILIVRTNSVFASLIDQLNVQHDRIVYILPLTWVPQQNNAAFLYTYGVVSRLYDHGLDEGGVSSPKSDSVPTMTKHH